MKKLIIALCVATLPMMVHAQSEGLFTRKKMKAANADMTVYKAKGAVPEENGVVMFK
ncbi:MAG: hypothetical protein K2O61_03000 [Bacteroidaceae bacterium]|nr:hypothetical protein [Bacteroidaceae bacterium]